MKKINQLDLLSHIVLFSALLLAVGVIVAVHYNEYSIIRKNITHIEKTSELDKKVNNLRLDIQAMIINQRGYIMTGEKAYLDIYTKLSDHLDDYVIEISRSFKAPINDEAIKNITTKLFDLKAYLDERVERRSRSADAGEQKGVAEVKKLLSLYESISIELDNISEITKVEYQDDLQNVKVAYGNYSKSILMSSLISIIIFAVLGLMLIYFQRKTTRTESKLIDATDRLNLVVQATSDGVLDWDIKRNKFNISPKFKKLLGYEEDEISSDFDSIFDLIHPEDRLSTWLYAKKIITIDQPVYNQMFRMKHKDGSWSWISAKGIGFFDEKNVLERFIGIHTDVTLQKQLEGILKYSKDKAEIEGQQKTDFLAYMSHEIRSPMSAVVGLSKILSETQPLTEQQKEYISAINTSANTIYGLLNNILDLSKLDNHAIKIERADFNLQQILANTIALSSFHAREKGLRLSPRIPPEANASFYGDPYRIRQVVSNLINNAIKFTHHGSVDLIVKLHDEQNGLVKIEILVKDTGIGIPSDKLAEIFNPYTQGTEDVTRKYGGTGLGLSICKQLVELMNGKIEVKSVEGQGSEFYVTLQLEKSSEKVVSLEKKAARSQYRNKKPRNETSSDFRILVVEDYEPNVIVARTVIEGLGYKCSVVDTAKEAIVELSSKNGKDIGLVLMDIQLPDMNGFEAARLIRKLEEDNSEAPRKIIAMTAHNLLGDREKCLQAGMDDYIAKPFTPEELSEKINSSGFKKQQKG